MQVRSARWARGNRSVTGASGARVLGERTKMRFGSGSEPREIVAAFENRNELMVAALGGKREEELGQIPEVLIGQEELAEGIALARIKARRDENQIRMEGFGGRQEAVCESSLNFAAARSGRKRAIDRGA